MSFKIDKLTLEQEALIQKIRDEWLQIALDTSPSDKQKAEEAVNFVYECGGLKPPKEILWFDNPLAALIWIVTNKEVIGRFVNYPLWFDIQKAIDISIDNFVSPDLKQSIRFNCFSCFINENSSILAEVFYAIGDRLDEVLLDYFGDRYDTCWSGTIESAVEDFPYGIYDFENLALYVCFHTIGIDCSKLEGLWATAKHCGVWWSFAEVAAVIPKPSVMRLDVERRLHAEGEPALVYEGLYLYAYHGVILPEIYGKVHPKEWQVSWLETQDNDELRRVLIKGIGDDRCA